MKQEFENLKYELNSLILSSSQDDEETAFVFMDGVAIQVESIDNPVPVKSPIALVYPRVDRIRGNKRMQNEIEYYRGHAWDGDYYSIALKYGQISEITGVKNFK